MEVFFLVGGSLDLVDHAAQARQVADHQRFPAALDEAHVVEPTELLGHRFAPGADAAGDVGVGGRMGDLDHAAVAGMLPGQPEQLRVNAVVDP